MPSSTTSDRILDAALSSFSTRGYEATSLDAMAKGLELTKQSILYWFPSKDFLLEAVIARSAGDLSAALETAKVVLGALTHIGLEHLVGESRAWINVTREFLSLDLVHNLRTIPVTVGPA